MIVLGRIVDYRAGAQGVKLLGLHWKWWKASISTYLASDGLDFRQSAGDRSRSCGIEAPPEKASAEGGCGGIGRRAGFRYQWLCRGGSSPSTRTIGGSPGLIE